MQSPLIRYNAGEIGENVFNGRSVCLWMLVNRKSLTKLSDFKSFHLLDALNDFKKAAVALNLTPEIWISLENRIIDGEGVLKYGQKD